MKKAKMDMNPEEAIMQFYSEADPTLSNPTLYLFVNTFRKWLHYIPEHHSRCTQRHTPAINCGLCRKLFNADFKKIMEGSL